MTEAKTFPSGGGTGIYLPGIERRAPNFRGLSIDDGGPRWQETARKLALLGNDRVSEFDVGALNIFCALGLNGAKDLDPNACYDQLVGWTKQAESYTLHCLPRFRSSPEQFEHSLPKFQMLCLVTVLQRDLGVNYHLPFSQGEYNASDSRNLFIHGILSGHGGTCASLPVLYVAIGRRLGYPLFLVRAKEHLFVRWEGHGERFNIEATSPGFYPHDDQHYHTTPKALSEREIQGGFYLRNITRREELGCFFKERADCLFDGLCFSGAAFALRLAHDLMLDDPGVHLRWAAATVLYAAIAQAAKRCPQVPGARIDLRTLAMPRPKVDWERWAIPVARRELDRVISVTLQDCLFLRPPSQEHRHGCYAVS